MPPTPLPDKALATADLLREEAFRLRRILGGLEEENGKLASQLLAWQKWYKTGYKSQILFLEHQVSNMSSSMVNSEAETTGLTNASSSRKISSVALAPLSERPEVSHPPLPIRGANGELVAPGYGEVVTYSDAVLEKIQERGEKSRQQVAGPIAKPVAPPKPQKGQMSEEQQTKWDSFLARQTTECFGLASTESVEKKSTVSDFRQKMASTNLGFHGLQGLRTILRMRFGGSLIQGWRVGLSPNGRKRIGFAELCTALNQTVGYAGNLRDLWLEMCPRDKGTIGVEDLDPKGAAEVVSLRQVLVAEHGSIRAAWSKVFKSEGYSHFPGVTLDEFTSACATVGFSGASKRAFRFLMHRDADHIDRVSVDDLDPEPGPESPKCKPLWKPARGDEAKVFKKNKNQHPALTIKPPEASTQEQVDLSYSVEPAPDTPMAPIPQMVAHEAAKKQDDDDDEISKPSPLDDSKLPSAETSDLVDLHLNVEETPAESFPEVSKDDFAGTDAQNESKKDEDEPTEQALETAEQSPQKKFVPDPAKGQAARKKAKQMLAENADSGMLPMLIETVFSSMRQPKEQPPVPSESKEEKDAKPESEQESATKPEAMEEPQKPESNEESAEKVVEEPQNSNEVLPKPESNEESAEKTVEGSQKLESNEESAENMIEEPQKPESNEESAEKIVEEGPADSVEQNA
eukprot:gnl/MRDRNA2_/MRDRNA2_95889_c0_seq1.p1 gnl/MRDRNA2_/MRDRNA2_95889_c0~~gnl/MRDRNA2_/MRDRNA2_95889_c0_seq1.p1  ORF type:complete len:688 (+),score=181.40 gnl/MRDRNA2_/MRDRNA2_95889_c0_seq1:96-2159(+)